jgi:ferric-dicitrate binding protein FerR (iron transport regulator)
MTDQPLHRTHPLEEPQDRFLELVLRYFDGDLNEAELVELNDLLRSHPENRREFVDHCTRISLIRETFDPQSETLRRHEQHAAGTRVKGRRGWRVAAAAGAVLVAVAGVLGWLSGHRGEASRIGMLEQVSGDVRILAADGHTRTVKSEAAIRSGDTVRTRGAQSTAVLGYPDGSRLTLAGDTAITCAERGFKSVVVHEGTLAASVEPQPGSTPMLLATPTAAVEVLQTQFLVAALPDHTDLSVTRGRVRLTRVSDGKAVEVPEGKRVLAGERTALTLEAIAGPPDTWEVDFEDGLPRNLSRGRFVNDGLPTGSKGGVAAVRVDLGAEGVLHEIASPDLWYRGLFAVHEDSHLHFTFKMDRPDWVNVFIIARGPDPNGPHTGNYLFNELSWRAPPGKWRTVSIPLSQFRRAGSGKGPPPSPDEVPYLVLFSSQGDRGLVLDRMGVARGGPGVVRYQDVEGKP